MILEIDINKLDPKDEHRVKHTTGYFSQTYRTLASKVNTDLKFKVNRFSDGIQIEYEVVQDDSTLSFFDFQLNPYTGNLYMNVDYGTNKLLILNFYDECKALDSRFNPDEFRYNLEGVKLKEVHFGDLFKFDLNSSLGASGGSIIKRYLDSKNIESQGDKVSLRETVEKPIVDDIIDVLLHLRCDLMYVLNSVMRACLEQSMSLPLFYRDIAECVAGYNLVRRSRRYYAPYVATENTADKAYGASQTNALISEDREVSKGEKLMFNSLELLNCNPSTRKQVDKIRLAIDEGADSIKKVIKTTAIKDIVKGASLSSVVKKIDNINKSFDDRHIETINRLDTVREIVALTNKFCAYISKVLSADGVL